MKKLSGRDYISLMDYSREEIETILDLSFDLKRRLYARDPHPLLAGKNLGMLFWNPSTRTRISFETGMSQLGGHAQYYTAESVHANVEENWVDTAQVMSRYLDGLVIRMYESPLRKYGDARDILMAFADNANIPVINAMDDEEHPCQAMADTMTIIEKFGAHYRQKKVAVVWVNFDTSCAPSMAHSTALIQSALGMKQVFAYPPGFDLDPKYMNEAKRRAEQYGGTLEITNDINEACSDADVILSTYWGVVPKKGTVIPNKEEFHKITAPFAEDWIISKKHFDIAAKNAIFMNCMPLWRGVQATSEVVDGPMSVIYQEAENRLHVQKAILSLVMA